MHILFLSDNFPPEVNASASRVFERACYWVRWGHQVTVITSAPNFPEGKLYSGYKNKWYQTEMIEGICVVRVKTFMSANRGTLLRILDFVSYMLMAIIAGIWQKKPDMVVATSPQFFAAVAGWVLSKFKRKPFVFELSDLWPESITAVGAMRPSLPLRLLERLELFLYRQAKTIIALTSAFKTNLTARGITPEKIHVITNGVDLSRYAPSSKDKELITTYQLQDKFVVGYIGTLGMAHDLSNVIKAAEYCQDDPNIHFIFVGGGAETMQLKQLATQLRNINFIPRQSKSEIARYWSLCDLALVHLKNDPAFASVLPSKLFEIMGMGLPICCVAPTGEATRIVTDTDSGINVPPGNPELLAKSIMDLTIQPEQLTAWANNSYSARLQFTRETQARLMIEVLNCSFNQFKLTI